jgi:hypothetical protein
MIVQAIVTVLLFALLASPFMFRTVTGLTGGLVANATTGQPKPVGLIVHGLVFVILRGLLSRTVSLYGRSSRDEQNYARQNARAAEARGALSQALRDKRAPPPPTRVETADDKKARFAASQEARRSRQALRAAQ